MYSEQANPIRKRLVRLFHQQLFQNISLCFFTAPTSVFPSSHTRFYIFMTPSMCTWDSPHNDYSSHDERSYGIVGIAAQWQVLNTTHKKSMYLHVAALIIF